MSIDVKNYSLSDIIELFNFSEEEKKKFINIHLPVLNFIEYDELKEMLEFLSLNGIHITKAIDAKVCVMSLSDIKKNIGLIDNPDLCKSYPNLLTHNALDIRKRISYCQKANIPIKDENDKYFGYILRESEFNKLVNQNNFSLGKNDVSDSIEENTLEPKDNSSEIIPFETANINDNDFAFTSLIDEPIDKLIDEQCVDIKEYNSNPIESDIEDLGRSIKSFAEIKEELSKEKERLSNFEDYKKNLTSSFIGFDDFDFDFEENEMGRAA